MSISGPFIARPVATSLLAAALLMIGLLGYRALPVSSLPQVAFPTIVVTTSLPGASAATMAVLVTAPLERHFGQTPALEDMTSTSSFGLSQITLRFALDRAIDGAAQDVQAAINAAAATLPRNLPHPPTYAKVNPADAPVLTLALSSATAPPRQLADLADTLVSQRLAEIAGVGRVAVQGGSRPAIRIEADLAALAAKGLALEDLRAAIAAANVAAPKGSLDGPQQAHAIAANDQIADPADYGRIAIPTRGGASVLLRDVAAITEGVENERVGAWLNRRPAVLLDIQKHPEANVVATVDAVHRQLPRIRAILPVDVALDVVSDRTGVIRASIHEVQLALALSVGLVIMVVLLFLRTWSATLIAGVTLPLSLVGTFAVMWLLGFSLDNLSLMALTISAGFVVDDAIVMIENIARRRELGEDAMTAAKTGAAEIGFTVVSLTASLLAVFIPLLFMGGLVGRMFREFALTLSIAVVVSMVVSLTLTPMMAARLLGRGRAHAETAGWMARAYARSLSAALHHRALTLLVTLATLAATIWLYAAMPKSFLPQQDTGLVTVSLRADAGASFREIARVQDRAAELILRLPEVAAVAAAAGAGPLNPTPNAAALTVVLKPHNERNRAAAAVAAEIDAALRGWPDAAAIVKPVQDVQISARRSLSQYQYTLTAASEEEARRQGEALLAQLRADPLFANAGSVEEEEGLEVRINVDRVRAGQFGVSQQAVADLMHNAFAQRPISTIYDHANQYRVILEAAPRQRADPTVLDGLRVTGAAGAQVPLSALASIERVAAPLAISRQKQFPAFTISFDVAGDASLEEAVARVGDLQRRLPGSAGAAGGFSGEAEEFRASLAGQPWLIIAAIIAIYIVLGVLYESAIHPVTILSTLPSAGIGALLALSATGQHLTVISVIAIVLLMGIVKKNAIMMIDFALAAERGRGLAPEAAIVEAATLRFRPIMMTTLAALFGALPLALASGPGAELRMPLGVAIIGGIVLSQLLTLYTTPVVYLTLDRLRLRGENAPELAPEPGE
jgi:multidrug efflux pump